MTNREFYNDKLIDISLIDGLAVNRKTLAPCGCCEIRCSDCIGYDSNCNYTILKWANSEYTESCPFEKDELVEVSDNEKDWKLRHFARIEESEYEKKYVVYLYGLKSIEAEEYDISHYVYCRKYGTLGGLVKEEKNEKTD